MDIAAFREAFPAFTQALHPDARVAYWLRLAGLRLSAERLGVLWDDAVALFIAHQLTMEADPESAARGPVTSESRGVGQLSKTLGYAGPASGQPEGGHWNATIYGQQLRELLRLVGAGGAVV